MRRILGILIRINRLSIKRSGLSWGGFLAFWSGLPSKDQDYDEEDSWHFDQDYHQKFRIMMRRILSILIRIMRNTIERSRLRWEGVSAICSGLTGLVSKDQDYDEDNSQHFDQDYQDYHKRSGLWWEGVSAIWSGLTGLVSKDQDYDEEDSWHFDQDYQDYHQKIKIKMRILIIL